MTVQLVLDNSVESYRLFLRVKQLPAYRICGHVATFPDEYAATLGLSPYRPTTHYEPHSGLLDYQRDIARLAVEKRKFAVFAECGLGKTFIMSEFARHAANDLPDDKRILIVSPLMVIDQTISECGWFYDGGFAPEKVDAAHLQAWLDGSGGRVGITNYEAIRDGLTAGKLGALLLDESSYLKSAYGKWGQRLIELGQGLPYKLCLTGTPAPNDRIEFANHAVFLDQFPNVNAFLARFFVNRGQTGERWELKAHALRPFYLALSHWSIFLNNPATYGWQDNTESIPPIHVHIHDVDITAEQQDLLGKETGTLFTADIGGICNRTKLSGLAKGRYKGQSVETHKPAFIRSLVDSWPEESTIIWCIYNHEQELMEQTFPGAASIAGDTPHDTRMALIEEFKSGRRKVLISKAKVLGFGLNLQRCTRMVFSGLQDSWESFHQCVKRANRIGSTLPLNVHIPITDIERPMVETVLKKAGRIQRDTEEQEQIFREIQKGLQNG